VPDIEDIIYSRVNFLIDNLKAVPSLFFGMTRPSAAVIFLFTGFLQIKETDFCSFPLRLADKVSSKVILID